jgi:hypothetical protein
MGRTITKPEGPYVITCAVLLFLYSNSTIMRSKGEGSEPAL